MNIRLVFKFCVQLCGWNSPREHLHKALRMSARRPQVSLLGLIQGMQMDRSQHRYYIVLASSKNVQPPWNKLHLAVHLHSVRDLLSVNPVPR